MSADSSSALPPRVCSNHAVKSREISSKSFRKGTALALPIRTYYARKLLPARGSTLRPFVRLLQIATGFVERTLRVVVGLNGLTIFAGGTCTLSGKIENLSQLDVTPDLCPARLAIPVQAVAIRIR